MPGKPFQPCPIFVGKERRIPVGEALDRSSTHLGSDLTYYYYLASLSLMEEKT
jgi:hypothetical protein